MRPTTRRLSPAAAATVALIALLATTAGCSTSAGAPTTAPDAGNPVDGLYAIVDGGSDADTTSHADADAHDNADADAHDNADVDADADAPDDAGADAVDAPADVVTEGPPDIAPASVSDGSADLGESGPATSVCARFCAKVLARGCPSDDPLSCVAQCDSVLASASCGLEYGDLAACGADRAVSDFVCNSGSAALADGICATQEQAFADCLLFGA